MFKNKTQAIMMAAGLGSRVGEITHYIPKSLIPVKGQPMIEHNIDYMVEAGIKKLVMVVGYKKEMFSYLIEKYKNIIEIIQVENPLFNEYNTFSSLYIASEYFDRDSFIVTSDIYPIVNIYQKYGWLSADKLAYSYYIHKFEKNLDRPEWIANLENDEIGQYIVSVEKNGFEGSVWSGISFWLKEDLLFIKEVLYSQDWSNPKLKSMFWDEILFPYYKQWHVHVRCLENNNEIFEVDNEYDLLHLKYSVNDTQSIESLKNELKCRFTPNIE